MKYKYKQNLRFKAQARRSDSGKKRHGIWQGLAKLFAITLLLVVAYVISPVKDLSFISTFERDLAICNPFVLKDIRVIGMHKIDPNEIIRVANIVPGNPLFDVYPMEIKQKIEQLPWVASSSVERIIPETIVIRIEEEKPYAIFNKGDRQFYVNYFGKIIDQVASPEDTLNYIVLKGDNANLGYAEILDELYLYPQIYKNIDSLNKIALRRWDVILKGNVLIRLPEGKISGALTNLQSLNLHEHYLEVCKEIDLRFMPDKIYIKF